MSLKDNDVCICGVSRTPMGNFQGSLSSLKAPQLAAIAIKDALAKAGIAPDSGLIDEVYMGNVVSANVGQAPATQASILAGIPTSVPSSTINKVCASGMKAVIVGAMQIRSGNGHVIVCGGMESMSQAPFYMTDLRSGHKFGHHPIVDGLARDGLEDAYNGEPMGNFAEKYAQEACIYREEQDEYALASYERSIAAHKAGKFKKEIVPVEIKNAKGAKTVVEVDEECFARPVSQQTFASLKPSFKLPVNAPKGSVATVTAGNASTMNDGASAVILVSGKKVKELGLTPIAIIKGWGDAQQEPARFVTTPAIAIKKALDHASVPIEKINFWEINEAFSVVALANMKLLGLPHDRVNVYGGAVAIGHPLGSSGSRIIGTLCSILSQEGGKYGVAGICNGGGGASAVVLEAYSESNSKL